MATFGIVVRNKRNDGFYPVFIRVSHKSVTAYIKTSFVVSDRGLKKTYTKAGKEKTEISDPLILKECMNEIAGYVRRLNDVDNERMTVQEVVNFLTTNETELSFSRFAEEYITDMKNKGRDHSSVNYVMSVKRLYEYMKKEEILFSELTVSALSGWIESMSDSPRKRNLYPTCIKTMFNSAILKYNDEDRDIIRIKKNPFSRIKIPCNKQAEKRSVDTKLIKRFFSTPVAEKCNNDLTKESIAHDVCMMMFCLAGINAADLYDLPKESLENGVLHYKRKKTRDKSNYGAYTEIEIPKLIKPLFEKYKGKKRLLLFSERYCNAGIFSDTVSNGCKRICVKAGIQEKITPYSFRHSWATIAINECKATMDDVAFALNHASSHKITSIYVKPDYTRIDKLNKKVISKVF